MFFDEFDEQASCDACSMDGSRVVNSQISSRNSGAGFRVWSFRDDAVIGSSTPPPPFLAVEWIPIVQWKAAVDHRNPFVNTTIAPYRRETADGSLDGSEEQWRAPSSFESNRLSPHNRLVCGRTLWNRNAPTLPALAQVPQGPCQFGNERTAAFHWNWVPSPRQTKIRLVKSKRSTRLDILALFYFPNKAWRINLRNCNLFFRIVYKSCPFSVDVELGYWMRMVSAGCCFHNQVRPLLLRTNQVQN